MGIIAIPLGWIMKGLYYVVKNYGIALLLFTFVTRLIIFPLAIKQQKSTAKMALIAPELEKIKKKYGKNQQKMQEEQMALYAKTGINPMASCLPMIVTMVILFALIPIIYGPLTYISNADKDDLNDSNSLIANVYIVSSDLHSDDNVKYVDEELKKLYDDKKITEDEKKEIDEKKTVLEKYLFLFEKRDGKTGDDLYTALSDYYTNEDNCKNASKALKDEDKLTKKVNEAIKKHTDIDAFMLNEEYISKNLVTSRPELMTFSFVNKDGGKYEDILPESVISAAKDIDYKSFGLDMGVIPSFKDMTWIIPFASFILQVAVTIVSQYLQKKYNPAARSLGMGMKITFIILPVFSLWIGFSYPAGLGLYWCYSSLMALIQTIVLNVIYNPTKMQALVQAEAEKNKKNGKKTMFAKMAEQNLERMGKAPVSDDDDDEDGEERKLSKAEKAAEDRRKIAAARKRMAEKYGEEYQEFADEDEEEDKPKPQQGSKKKKKKNNNNNSNNNNKNSSSEQNAEAESDSEEADGESAEETSDEE